MIDWVDSMGSDWGHWMRKAEAKQGQIQGTLGRIKELGFTGAAIKSHGSKIPVVDFPEDIAEFHRAWLRLADEYRMIIWVDYKHRCSKKKKFKLMAKKKDSYYRLRGDAMISLVAIMGGINIDSRMG